MTDHFECLNASMTMPTNKPAEYSVGISFNVFDLSYFDASDDLRTNPSQERENDAMGTA